MKERTGGKLSCKAVFPRYGRQMIHQRRCKHEKRAYNEGKERTGGKLSCKAVFPRYGRQMIYQRRCKHEKRAYNEGERENGRQGGPVKLKITAAL
ncbi:hypothetical protein [Paenibacillus sp. N3.4]|uniref:hypothetical protein n=1 Tax=Paenibacillus sp. N3.4 TaxID=2603222 RepID=UPI0011CB5424|nr:hypothetical protein [Paenibacillus sp. N3.4]TXK78250.1 hypothetical protein FU659_20875 [Paenibacillus sp. N3.4]